MNNTEDLKQEILNSISTLKSGGTLVYPTDTIWGLGCDALNRQAIEKIYNIKKRPSEKGLIILIHNENLLMKYVREVPEQAWDLVRFSERPLTIIYPQAINLPENLVAADGSIAIRVVKDGFVHQLMNRYNRPLVSTSANFSNHPAPRSFGEIDPLLLKQADYVVNLQSGSGVLNKPSVIMKLNTNGSFTFIRR